MPQPQFIISVVVFKMSAGTCVVFDDGLCDVWDSTGLPVEIWALYI